jgi:tryptophan synthase alpha chain
VSRISSVFDNLKEQGKKALTCYVVSGDPRPESTLPIMNALVELGVDVIELGIPFSDPMAEGPVIQLGHERALEHGTSLRSTLDLVKAFRETNSQTPIVLMGYANPIVRMGFEAFAELAHECGVDGVLTVDLPPEEATELDSALAQRDLDNIFLVAPTTTSDRLVQIAKLARGFIYYVSLKGVTGAGHLDVDSVRAKLADIKAVSDLPVQVGFGIKDADSARQVGETSDGVVVGSALVKLMAQPGRSDAEIIEALNQLLGPIRASLNS